MNKIRGYRVMLGMSQKDMARIFGITPQAYSMKERGLTAFTDKEKMIFMSLLKDVAKNETVESIFFNHFKTKKDEVKEVI